jgi:soluble lytic murein transglycosylase-like protein
MKKLLPILFLLTLALVFVGCANSAHIEESSEPVTLPAPETSSTIETESETTASQVETEPTIETAPEDDYIFYDIPFDLDTQKEIIKICSEYGFSYELILGMISVESSFRPGVIGDGGKSFGLMQIQPRYWSETMEREDVTNLLDPLQNVRCGCAILRDLKDKYGTEYRALQAYNTGRPDTYNGYAEKVYRRIGELTIYGG